MEGTDTGVNVAGVDKQTLVRPSEVLANPENNQVLYLFIRQRV